MSRKEHSVKTDFYPIFVSELAIIFPKSRYHHLTVAGAMKPRFAGEIALLYGYRLLSLSVALKKVLQDASCVTLK